MTTSSEDGGSDAAGFSKAIVVTQGVAVLCALIATGVTCSQLIRHFKNYTLPRQQRHIIRILTMVPVFAWCSVLSLTYLSKSYWFDAVCSCYEAFVIYSFFALLLNYLGEDHLTQKTVIAQHPPGKIFWPWSLLGWTYNPRSGGFLVGCKRWTLQYVIVHPVLSIIEILLEMNHSLDTTTYSPLKPYFWIISIEFVSVSLAMNALVQFWIVIADDLRPYKPMPKFISVKAVVFFTWFQSVILQGMVTMGWIQDGYFGEASTVSAGIGYFVICIEMAAVSIWHHNIFGHEMYKVGTTPTNFMHGMKDVLLAKDVIADMRTVLQKHKKGTNPVHVRAANADQLGQLKRDPDVPEMEESNNGESRNGPIPLASAADRPISSTSKRESRGMSSPAPQAGEMKEAREDANLMGWRSKGTPAAAAAQFSIGGDSDDESHKDQNDEDDEDNQAADLGARVQPIDLKNVKL